MTGPELAAYFNTSVQAVYVQAHKIGLNKSQPNKIELTTERAVWMRCNFPHMSNVICGLILGVSPRTVVRFARRLGLAKTGQFMCECQAHTAKKARESHLKNGTYPAKGYSRPTCKKANSTNSSQERLEKKTMTLNRCKRTDTETVKHNLITT